MRRGGAWIWAQERVRSRTGWPIGAVTDTSSPPISMFRFLDRVRLANLKIRQFDVGRDGFPASSFDLIHARSLLCHVSARNTVLTQAVEWLAPGGWLVVGEPYMFTSDTSPYPPLRRFYRAVDQRWIAQGSICNGPAGSRA